MDRNPFLGRRNAAPPAAGAAPRSSEKDGKRSMLDSFKKTFKRVNFPDLILESQVRAFSRLKGLKAGTSTLKGSKDGNRLKSPLVPSLLASPATKLSSSSNLPAWCPDAASPNPDTVQPMPSPLVIASQKRKQVQEHDDAPSRTKAKSRPGADDPEKRYIVEEWVNQQDEPISPTALPEFGTCDNFPLSLTPPLMDDTDDPPIGSARSRSATHMPGSKRESLKSILPHRPSRESIESVVHPSQSTAPQSELQGVTSCTQPYKNDERRGSTATTTNMTYRDSIFSSCPSVATGLTSPSEISLALTGRRVHTDSRSSSFFSKASPRSSIASTTALPQFFLHRTMSWNTAGRFDDMHDLAQHPVPNVPKADPLRSHPTFFKLDLGNAQNAVVIDQVVKMGHCAQERRVNHKIPLFDAAQHLAAAPTAGTPKELTPIKETASDDGAPIARKLQLQGQEPARAPDSSPSRTRGNGTPERDTVHGSDPNTPESTSRLSDDIMNGGTTRQSQTPATSVTAVSDMTVGEVLSTAGDDSDDSLSDITDYTEESLFDAVEALAPGLSNPLMLSIVLTFKEDVLDLILARITSMLGDSNGAAHDNDDGKGSGASTDPSSSNGSLQTESPARQRNPSAKRELDDDRDGREGDDGDDRGKRPRTTPAIPSDLETRYSRLACPFFKRFPDTKWKKACCGPGFRTVHRMKEHVYRTHDHPYCQRCHATFTDEKALEEHAQAETQCARAQGPLHHKGITPQQRKSLKSRKKPNRDANQTEADLWVEAYRLLFPEVPRDQIPSPYYDVKSYQDLLTSDPAAAAFRQLLEEDLPMRISHRLQERVRLIPGAESNFIQAQLPDMVRTCVQEALGNVPPQLLTGDERVVLPESGADPAATSTDSPDSHGTAQVGSQFATSVEPPREPTLGREQSDAEVALPGNAQAWAPPLQDDLDIGAMFRGVCFPNPLAENAEVLMPSNNSGEQPIYDATGFATLGMPSAMLAGAPVLSPRLLPQMSVDGWVFGGNGFVTLQESLTNMPNSTFLFTQEERPSPAESWQDLGFASTPPESKRRDVSS